MIFRSILSSYQLLLAAPLLWNKAAQAVPCSLISLVVDESRSMSGEQAFLRDEAMPNVVDQLQLNLERKVFVCSYGFGSSTAAGNPELEGCSDGFDLSDYQYTASGSREDGWEAIQFAHDHWETVSSVDGINVAAECDSVSCC